VPDHKIRLTLSDFPNKISPGSVYFETAQMKRSDILLLAMLALSCSFTNSTNGFAQLPGKEILKDNYIIGNPAKSIFPSLKSIQA